MRRQVNRADIISRVEGHTEVSYMTLVSIIKGVTLYSAANAISIVWTGNWWTWDMLPLWVASFAAMVLTYDAVLVGMLASSWRLTLPDIALPFFLGTAEFLLFAALQNVGTIRLWHPTFAAFNAINVLLLWNAIAKVRVEHYEPELEDLGHLFTNWMRRDRVMVLVTTVIWIAIAAVADDSPAWRLASGVPAAAIMLTALVFQERHRHRITATVISEEAGETDTPPVTPASTVP